MWIMFGNCSLSFCVSPLYVDVVMYCCRKMFFEIAIMVCVPDVAIGCFSFLYKKEGKAGGEERCFTLDL